MPGPSPKPAALKKLEGNPGQRRLRNEPKPAVEYARKPPWIEGEAAEEWDRVVAAMPPGFYTGADEPILTVYVQAWVTYRAAIKATSKSLMAKGSTKQTIAHPALAIVRAQAEIIIRATDRLGMSPVARARLDVAAPLGNRAPDAPPSKFDGLILMRGGGSKAAS